MLDPLFISHGAPTLPFEDVPARDFLKGLAATMERPRAIVAVSAHWETSVPTVNAVARNETIHDFRGFPAELYKLGYPAPGDAGLAGRIVELLDASGIEAAIDHTRGLDHGAWVPLMLAWPDADIPVVQLSVQSQLGPAHHLALGRALQPLAEENILIFASGSFTHDLSSWRGQGGMSEPGWVSEFAEWFDKALIENRVGDLLAYRDHAPHARRNHPTEEHLLPLFVALGAAGQDPEARRLHSSSTYGVLRMDAYSFAGKSARS